MRQALESCRDFFVAWGGNPAMTELCEATLKEHDMNEALENTDREIHQFGASKFDDGTAFVTAQGMLGIKYKGRAVVQSVSGWHDLYDALHDRRREPMNDPAAPRLGRVTPEFRLECLRLAVGIGANESNAVDIACKFENYIGGMANLTQAKMPGAGRPLPDHASGPATAERQHSAIENG